MGQQRTQRKQSQQHTKRRYRFLMICGWLFLSAPILVQAQGAVAALTPIDKHLPKDLRSQSVYDKAGTILLEKYQYYYDHWAEQQVKHGLHTEWSKKGTVRRERDYREGQLIQEVIHSESGRILRERRWLKGQKHGIQRSYTMQQAVRREIPYQAGQKEGLEKAYYRSGQLKWARIYADGQKQGKTLRYSKDGRKKQKRNNNTEAVNHENK